MIPKRLVSWLDIQMTNNCKENQHEVIEMESPSRTIRIEVCLECQYAIAFWNNQTIAVGDGIDDLLEKASNYLLNDGTDIVAYMEVELLRSSRDD